MFTISFIRTQSVLNGGQRGGSAPNGILPRGENYKESKKGKPKKHADIFYYYIISSTFVLNTDILGPYALYFKNGPNLFYVGLVLFSCWPSFGVGNTDQRAGFSGFSGYSSYS